MKIGITLVLFIYGVIHFMGFAKAYNVGQLAQFSKEISKPLGILWLCAGLIFILIALLYFLNNQIWTALAIIAVVLSQILIFISWNDAKYVTIANLIVLVAAIIGFGNQHFEDTYRKDVLSALKMDKMASDIVTEKDLEVVPPLVQNYLRYVGVIGKPKIYNVRLAFHGEMRDKGKYWFKFTSDQFNFFYKPTRLFFMKAKVMGFPTIGYHRYQVQGAEMTIKLLSVLSIVHIKNKELFATETVTYFNDLCLFAPAALINKQIQWVTLNELSVKASFKAHGNNISAILYFNELGQLINFTSNDRYSVVEMKTFPFSTPIRNYKIINGLHLPTYGEAIWNYPEGDFMYGKFHLKSVEYNVSKLNG
tara:strand:- start:24302 stop:25393 length:1092 start_codon:yes stop_codon:yes gene_type:complete